MQPRRKRRVEVAAFGRLEEIPKGRKGICWDFNDGACRYGEKKEDFVTSAQSVQAVIQGSPAEELVLQRKGLLRWLVDPLRSGLLSFEQRGTDACNITFSCNGYLISGGHYHSV